MPVQGGAHRPRLEEWHPFSAQVANDDDVDMNLSTSSSRKPDLHHSFTHMCHSHRSSPLTSAQTSSYPKEYICYTKLTRGAWMVITISLAACLLEFDQNLTAMRHAPCGRQTIASQNMHDGETMFISQYIRAGLVPVATTGAPSPTTGLNQILTAMHPSPIVPTIQPTEFCGSL